MTRDYARDPMGNGCDLSDEAQKVLIQRLRTHPTTRIFLAFDGKEPVGIATCFLGFSTFAAHPLVNIHDLHVIVDHRRRGIARRLIEAVEADARELNCCKLTLEVQENNHPALAFYRSLGFVRGQYQEAAGGVLFREKRLQANSDLPDDVLAFLDAHLLDLGGSRDDPSTGATPIQYDELRIEHDQGIAEIVVCNRAIVLFSTVEAVRRIWEFCCRLDQSPRHAATRSQARYASSVKARTLDLDGP